MDAKRSGAVILHCIGLLYMFVAIAIACDECFVPSLEVISDTLDLSPDVAGATFMAAGGSAPEFFTSLIGSLGPEPSDIGTGTILGSAVFNVLFVIGACAIISPEPLHLTWFPLARDASFYTVDLIVVTCVFLDEEVRWWEALILFMLYLAYASFMVFSERLELWLKAKMLGLDAAVDVENPQAAADAKPKSNEGIGRSAVEPLSGQQSGEAGDRGEGGAWAKSREDGGHLEVPGSASQKVQHLSGGGSEAQNGDAGVRTGTGNAAAGTGEGFTGDCDNNMGVSSKDVRAYAMRNRSRGGSRSRTMLDPTSSTASAIAKKEGFHHVSLRVEKNLGHHVTHVHKHHHQHHHHGPVHGVSGGDSGGSPGASIQLDSTGGSTGGGQGEAFQHEEAAGSPSAAKEPSVATPSAAAPYAQATPPHSTLGAAAVPAASGSGELTGVLPAQCSIPHQASDPGIKSSNSRMSGDIPPSVQEEEEEDEEENEPLSFWPPEAGSGIKDWAWYIMTLPIVFCLVLTVPDVRRWRNCFVATFCLSICWIAAFTWVMVWFATVIGETCGIEEHIMGLTILAAGTSVPDLLTSMIVAREGHGDMAVSSSIGSNIFDVTVGLPIPWLLYAALNNGKAVTIETEGMEVSVLLLIAMLGFTIGTIVCHNWVMSKFMGASLMFLYFAFGAVSVALTFVPDGKLKLIHA